ncbi:hypothetical protein [Pseudomonas sp. LB1P83]
MNSFFCGFAESGSNTAVISATTACAGIENTAYNRLVNTKPFSVRADREFNKLIISAPPH